MSASIGINKSKFVIFGAGHDYTLADSGEGEKVFFSHPFVPLGGINYAGQYYFKVPKYDENDETAPPVIIDAVKDDQAHITFTPALGTAFSTAGETVVKVHYRREYVYAESTILVEKELEQTITVVNHGSIVTYGYECDVYSDGYGYIHPNGNSLMGLTRADIAMTAKKLSSIPWRTTALNRTFRNSTQLTDIEELQYADTSGLTYLGNTFESCQSLTDLKGIENWDTSKVTSFQSIFKNCSKLADITALKDWNFSKAVNMSEFFYACWVLTDYSPIEDWDVSNVQDMSSMFEGSRQISQQVDGGKIHNLDFLSKWNVSKVSFFQGMFGNQFWLSDISGVSGWDVSSGVNFSGMFGGCALKEISALEDWDMSYAAVITAMFAKVTPQYSPNLDMDLLNIGSDAYGGYDIDGVRHQLTSGEVNNLQNYQLDASGVSDWEINIASPTSCFTSQSVPSIYPSGNAGETIINIPSWN